jgi:type IV secretion system protein TrbL
MGLDWRRVGRHAGVVVVVALAIAVAVSATHAQGGVLDNTQQAYRTTVRTWLGPMSALARRLFALLAGLEIAVSGMIWTLRRDSLDEIAAKFLLKFILLSVVLLLITGAGYWLPPIVNSFAYAGRIAGVAPVAAGPSEIVDLGVYMAFWAIDTTGLPIAPAAFLTAAFALVSRLVVLGAFLWVAAMLVLAWVESYVALAGGVLFLGFGAFRATAPIAENYLGYLVFLGVRLFVFYLLLGIGTATLTNALGALPRAMEPQQMAEVMAMAVIFAVLVLRIPASMANRVAGSGHFGLAQALRSF